MKKSIISSSAKIAKNALIDKYNVIIGDECIIEDNCKVLGGSIIGSNCRIGYGTVIGRDGFEIKNTCFGLKKIPHNGIVKVNDNVEIGAGCVIDKGLMEKSTILGKDTKLDSNIHIAHNCNIGKSCIITANVVIGGSTSVGEGTFIGLNAVLYNNLKIGNYCYICGGAIVYQNTKEKMKIIPRPCLTVPIS